MTVDNVLLYGCRETGVLIMKALPVVDIAEQVTARIAEFEKVWKFCVTDRTSGELRVKASLNRTGAESPWH